MLVEFRLDKRSDRAPAAIEAADGRVLIGLRTAHVRRGSRIASLLSQQLTRQARPTSLTASNWIIRWLTRRSAVRVAGCCRNRSGPTVDLPKEL
jgi:hypothetical protein